MAMTALGMGTRFAKFKGLGLAPLYTALAMFIWLVVVFCNNKTGYSYNIDLGRGLILRLLLLFIE